MAGLLGRRHEMGSSEGSVARVTTDAHWSREVIRYRLPFPDQPGGCMQVSYPKNCRRGGVRQINFEVDVKGRTVHATITCEAVLGMDPKNIHPADEERALKVLEQDYGAALEVVRRSQEGGTGDAGLPVFLSSINYPRP